MLKNQDGAYSEFRRLPSLEHYILIEEGGTDDASEGSHGMLVRSK